MARQTSTWMTAGVLSAALVTAQGRVAPPAPTDPAVDLVRVHATLTTSSPAVDLTLEGAAWANAVSPDPAARVLIDGPTVHVTRPVAGVTDVPLDIILAFVPPHASVAWTVTPIAPGSWSLEIDNANRTPARAVYRVDGGAAAARFTVSSDLLRDGGPLGPIRHVSPHLVLAFFYPWWTLDSWSSPQLIDSPSPPTSTDDPADLAAMMTSAKSIGIDAFVMSWSGKTFDGGIDDARMRRCLAAANASEFRMAALIEGTVANPGHVDGLIDPDTLLAWLEDIVDDYAGDAAYLKVNGHPVVFAYAAQRLSQAGWTDVLTRLRATGRDVLLVGEGINATRQGAFDGQFFYASNQFQSDDIDAFDRGQSVNVRTYQLLPEDTVGRRVWVATVSPGYDDTHVGDGRVPRVTDRESGAYYERQWRAALDNGADWVVITSWNEYFENTEIERSRLFGDRYQTLTAKWSTAFRALYPAAVPR